MLVFPAAFAHLGSGWCLVCIPLFFVWGANQGKWLVAEERIEGFHLVRRETLIHRGSDEADPPRLVLDGRDVGDPRQANVRIVAFVDVLGGASRPVRLHHHYHLVIVQNGAVYELARQDFGLDGLKAAASALARAAGGDEAEVKTVQIPGVVWSDEMVLSMWSMVGCAMAPVAALHLPTGGLCLTLLCVAAVVARATVISLRIAQAAEWQRRELSGAIGDPSAKPAMPSSWISTRAAWWVYFVAQALLLAAIVAAFLASPSKSPSANVDQGAGPLAGLASPHRERHSPPQSGPPPPPPRPARPAPVAARGARSSAPESPPA